MQNDTPHLVYKILTEDVWSAAAAGTPVPTMPIDTADGFIHLSTATQLAETLSLHFKGQSGLILLTIRTSDIADDLRWEPSRGGRLFPHVYGQIPRSAVANIARVEVAEDGTCTLPADIQ